MMKRFFFASLLLISGTSSFSQFGLYASAVYINNNGSSLFYNNTAPGLGQDIGSATFQGTSFGIFEQNSGTLKIVGSEIKTYKGGSDNVCSGTLYSTVYPQGVRPSSPVFSPIALAFYSDCFAPACNTFFGSFTLASGGGCCSAGDQKWQNPGTGVAANIDLTNYIPGDYTLELYYQYTGEDGGGGCGTSKYDNNNNNSTNYTAGFTITMAIPVSFGSIKVVNEDSQNSIYWNTYTESNTAFFQLQRSLDGIEFSNMGQLSAAGNSSTIRNYVLQDRSPANGTNYYRIKMLEFDGRFQYSPVVKTTNKHKSYWNISMEKDGINIYGLKQGDLVEMYNPLGTKLTGKNATESSLILPIMTYPGGIYFIQVKNQQGSTTKQVLITH